MQDRHSSRADSFFPGYTLFSVGGMAQGGEWSGQLLLEGRLILSRLHLVWCQRNGPGWGVVQAQQSGTVIPRGQTHSLQVTLCLVSEEWPRVGNSPGHSFLRADSFPPGYTLFSVGGMAQGKEWSNISRGQTHSLQVTLCLVSEEWPRVGNGPGSKIRNNPSSLVEKNGADSILLIFYVEGRHSFRPHRCE
jgi:hypothetical protein